MRCIESHYLSESNQMAVPITQQKSSKKIPFTWCVWYNLSFIYHLSSSILLVLLRLCYFDRRMLKKDRITQSQCATSDNIAHSSSSVLSRQIPFANLLSGVCYVTNKWLLFSYLSHLHQLQRSSTNLETIVDSACHYHHHQLICHFLVRTRHPGAHFSYSFKCS